MAAPRRYACIHGHFYQPPRENPWLEAIEQQPSAAPFHDWNERIEVECYGPNAGAKILDGEDRIVRLVNNYERISFDFGPTLLSWLEAHAPDTYAAIVAADRESAHRFDGHGSAMAQAFHHSILPLLPTERRRTEIRWGVADFEHRFGRSPEGMWLPETAVDLETLDLLESEGIAFALLSPTQAESTREANGDWIDVPDSGPDPSRPYRVELPSGRSIAVFFYDGPASSAIAFEGLLSSSDRFVARLLETFDDARAHDQLAHVATDGESYGHHHRHGEMALAAALDAIDARDDVELINYGAFLERHPPTAFARIRERTAWSCAHGLGRWSKDCGCHTGQRGSAGQRWRAPLRAALDELRETVDRLHTASRSPFPDLSEARDAYVEVVLKRSPETTRRFLSAHAVDVRSEEDRRRALEMLELERHVQLMYTSCGWFFDDVAGIEATQILAYAARASQLTERLHDVDPEPALLSALREAPANDRSFADGSEVYERVVRPLRVDLSDVAVHAAIRALFEEPSARSSAYVFALHFDRHHTRVAGRARLFHGRIAVEQPATGASAAFAAAALHLGDHNVVAGAHPDASDPTVDRIAAELDSAFDRADLPAAVRRIDRLFDFRTHHLRSLFRDSRAALLGRILQGSFDDAAEVLERLFSTHEPTMRFLSDAEVPIPEVFDAAAEFVVTSRITEAVDRDEPDLEAFREALATCKRLGLSTHEPRLLRRLEARIEGFARRLARAPRDVDAARSLDGLLELSSALSASLDLARARRLLDAIPPGAFEGDSSTAAALRSIADRLGFVEGFRPRGATLGRR